MNNFQKLSLICVPITENSDDAFFASLHEAEQTADAIELRLDYLSAVSLPRVIAELRSRIRQITKPLIFTFRPGGQGGKRDLSFEIDLVESFADSPPPISWSKVICSWHNFDETPPNLIEQFERIERTPAAVVKIATQANLIGDCLRLFEITERAKQSKPVIVLGMGMPGVMTRILALSRGAMLTFGALRRGAESASGQPTIAELRDLYRVNQLSRESDIFGVIGNPVAHSRSPMMHNAALRALNRDGVYLPFEVDEVKDFVRDFVHPRTKMLDWRLRGLSVTIPHKLAIIPHLDFIDETAKAIGAVNTVVVKDRELHGYNTDCEGAMKPLDALMDVKGSRVAVLGAGGSARAICYGLRDRGAKVTIYARNLDKAQTLAGEFQARSEKLESFDGQAEIVVNCTPVGMRGSSEGQSPVSPETLSGVKLVYDLIYTPKDTALLQAAGRMRCRTLGGSAMLVAQAVEQFRLWTGLEAPVEVMMESLENVEQT
jgi:3-dehydroquinate dehydratase/shikimate dehydrogenase